MNKVGNAIKERRKILKITQRTLAELAGVGINTLTKIERGEGNPTVEVLEKILDTVALPGSRCARRRGNRERVGLAVCLHERLHDRTFSRTGKPRYDCQNSFILLHCHNPLRYCR